MSERSNFSRTGNKHPHWVFLFLPQGLSPGHLCFFCPPPKHWKVQESLSMELTVVSVWLDYKVICIGILRTAIKWDLIMLSLSSNVKQHVFRTKCMLGVVFIRTPGTFPALALQYWQHTTSHSTSREDNMNSFTSLSFSVAALQFLPASNQFHLLPYRSCFSLAQKAVARFICH